MFRFIFLIILAAPSLFAQNTNNSLNFFKLGFPEKMWVITHPFIAKKSLKISIESRKIADKMVQDTSLDGDANGGQVDAFRHVFWMASLARQINDKKAQKLGIAHEKTNFREFKKNRNQGVFTHDAVSCEMDLKNNDIGIYLGTSNRNISADSLVKLTRNLVKSGKAWVISKNNKGESLDAAGHLVPEEKYTGLWENARCLVKSDIKRRK